jgi:F-type H+-transporting ATPase subunit epsilon
MAETFQLEFITPESRYYSGQVSMVEVPGTMGDFGVLPGHAPLVSTIRPGVVSVHVTSSETNKIFVVGGIAEINASKCTILAEKVIDIGGMTVMDAQARLNAARSKLENTFDATAKEDAEADLRVLEAILAAVA